MYLSLKGVAFTSKLIWLVTRTGTGNKLLLIKERWICDKMHPGNKCSQSHFHDSEGSLQLWTLLPILLASLESDWYTSELLRCAIHNTSWLILRIGYRAYMVQCYAILHGWIWEWGLGGSVLCHTSWLVLRMGSWMAQCYAVLYGWYQEHDLDDSSKGSIASLCIIRSSLILGVTSATCDDLCCIWLISVLTDTSSVGLSHLSISIQNHNLLLLDFDLLIDTI